jgi:hypothetical protein
MQKDYFVILFCSTHLTRGALRLFLRLGFVERRHPSVVPPGGSRERDQIAQGVAMKKDDLSYLKELLEGQLDYLQNQADHTVI